MKLLFQQTTSVVDVYRKQTVGCRAVSSRILKLTLLFLATAIVDSQIGLPSQNLGFEMHRGIKKAAKIPMAHRTGMSIPQLRAPVDHPEQLVWQVGAIPTSNNEKYCSAGRDENLLKQCDTLINLLHQESNKIDTSRGSLVDDRMAPEPTLGGSITRYKIKGKMEYTLTQPVD